MPSLTVVSSGLLLEELTFSGWTLGTNWSVVPTEGWIIFGSTPNYVLSPTPGGDDAFGVREFQWFRDDTGIDWGLYDGGDGTNGWLQQIASSTDRGITWTKHGTQSVGYDDGSSGTYPSVATGAIAKFSGTYYLHRVISLANYVSAPNTGLPAGPYEGDVWSASTVLGAWTFVTHYGPQGWANNDLLPGAPYTDGTTLIVEAGTTTPTYDVAYMTSSGPSGSWTVSSGPLFGATEFGGRIPENGKVWRYNPFNKEYCISVNLIAAPPNHDHTDANGIAQSTSLTNFSGADYSIIQRIYDPATTSGHIVGVMTPMTLPEGAVNGAFAGGVSYIPVAWDADPEVTSPSNAPGWHVKRHIRAGLLETMGSSLLYNNLSSTRSTACEIALTYTGIVVEISFAFFGTSTGAADISVELSNGSIGYRFKFQGQAGVNGLEVETLAGVLIQTGTVGSAGTTYGEEMFGYVAMLNGVLTAGIGGEEQINVADTLITSGTKLRVSGLNIQAAVRGLRAYSDKTFTVSDLPPSQDVNIRTFCGLPIDTVTADGSGDIDYTWRHYPMSIIEVASDPTNDATTTSGKIWGGDVLAFVADPTPSTRIGFL